MTRPGSVPWWPTRLKAVGWAVAFIVLGFVLTGMLTGVALAIIAAGRQVPITALGGDTQTLMVVQTAAGLVAMGGLTLLFMPLGPRLTLRELRWIPAASGRWARGLGSGVGLGAGTAALTLGLSALLGGARVSLEPGAVGDYLAGVGPVLLLLLPAALFEELTFRGVPQVMLARAIGRGSAVVLISLLFAAAHLANPNTTPLGLANIGLAGVFLGFAFYLPGGIWTAWGAHFGWNAMLAAVEAPVSGFPVALPWVGYSAGGPEWLTGGAFGPEGGITATLAVLLVAGVLLRQIAKRGTAA